VLHNSNYSTLRSAFLYIQQPMKSCANKAIIDKSRYQSAKAFWVSSLSHIKRSYWNRPAKMDCKTALALWSTGAWLLIVV